ncbi:putative dehydrogenase [Arthrobacter stackebrandtii]|uniref:Dehydrogenase n=1 Tax=Arthrobacter stackebrandtii TaxID=272161 RepID=A0ABS4YTX3_9MICC|nr:Gfo/Idh/MocA family oxidoreductase [Arthrobacter stackebrandtii]MBP2412255.1 putative dehydrogenase [Arthrobacter stackebrandtii]PYH02038.1 dehydrogenase [Arthrobacter stackebrandtii]
MTSPQSNSPGTRPLGVAAIGYAFMGQAHSNAWRSVANHFDVPAFEQKVLVGRDAGAVAAAAAKYGWSESATDWREVIAREDIDIIDICAPGWLHAEIATAALAAGKHVLVEKPLANSMAESVSMVAAAQAAREIGVRSMVGFNYRRIPALALARKLIADGELGTVRQVRASYLQDWLADPESPMTWRLRKETAGSGALGDIASHAVDQVQHLLGDTVIAASGKLHTFTTERPGPDGPEPVTVDDAAWATLEMAGGAVASVDVSRVALGQKNALRVEVYGTNGALTFNLENPNELFYLNAREPIEVQGFRRILVTEPVHPYISGWWPQGHVLGWEHSFTHQIRDFLLNIADGTDPSPSFEEGLGVQQVLAAIEDSSAAGGATVTLAEPAISTTRTS